MLRLKKGFLKKLGALFSAIFAAILLIFSARAGGNNATPNHVVRQPAVAGTFYPSDSNALLQMIDTHLDQVDTNIPFRVLGLVSPHAGYVFSGPVAAFGYKQLLGKRYETVIIIGPSHFEAFYGASIPNVTSYETPFGTVKLSPKVSELRESEIITSNERAHVGEHSIETQVPFLQKVLGTGFEIIPIVTGRVEPAILAKVLEEVIDTNTLVIASSDFSHYYAYDVAKEKDRICTLAIPGLDFLRMDECEACGKTAILVLMHIAEDFGWEGELLNARNSGDTQGDKGSVVGYASIAFFEQEELTPDEKKFLLELARESITTWLDTGKRLSITEEVPTDRLKKVQGCFVTLTKNGDLRGCIGHIFPQEELYECVIDNVVSAAVSDRRFDPVTLDELDEIKIEVSMLSVPEELYFTSGEDLLAKLVPGRDGIVLKKGFFQSTYLPQVWDQLPDKEVFLSNLCRKAGLSLGCWKDTNSKVLTYYALHFSE